MPPPCNRSSAACPSGREHNAVALALQRALEALAQAGIVVGDEERRGRQAWLAVGGRLTGSTERERRARARRAAPPELAAVLLDDLPRDGQPEPRALRLGGEELLEEPPATSGVMPGPVSVTAISTVSPEQMVLIVRVAALRQRLLAVLHEVQDGLPQQRAVDLHGRHRGIDAEMHVMPWRVASGPHELHRRAHHLVDRVLLEVGAREPCEGQVLLGERVEGDDLVADGRDEPGRLVPCRGSGRSRTMSPRISAFSSIAAMGLRTSCATFSERRPTVAMRSATSSSCCAACSAQRLGELGVEPLHLHASAALAVGDVSEREGGQPDLHASG